MRAPMGEAKYHVMAEMYYDSMDAMNAANPLLGRALPMHQGQYGLSLGGPLVKDRTTPPDAACIDFYLRPYDRNSGIEDAMKAYLSWEIDLVHDIVRDGTVHFGV